MNGDQHDTPTQTLAPILDEAQSAEASRLLHEYDKGWKEARDCLKDAYEDVHTVLMYLVERRQENLSKDALVVAVGKIQAEVDAYLKEAKKQKQDLREDKGRFLISLKPQ